MCKINSAYYKIEHLPENLCGLQVLAAVRLFSLQFWLVVLLALCAQVGLADVALQVAAHHKISVPCGSYEGLAPTCSTRFFQFAPKK